MSDISAPTAVLKNKLFFRARTISLISRSISLLSIGAPGQRGELPLPSYVVGLRQARDCTDSRSPIPASGKGKSLGGPIARFFRTCRAQLITRLTPQDTQSLETLNRQLAQWIEGEYHQSPHRGLEGQTPLERWAQVSDDVNYPDQNLDLDDLFLFETTRKVNNDRTVSLNGKLFEVDPNLIGERVTLRYNPAKPDARIQICHEGKFIEIARQVDVYANCFVKRHRRTGVIDSDTPAPPNDTSLNLSALNNNNNKDDPSKENQ